MSAGRKAPGPRWQQVAPQQHGPVRIVPLYERGRAGGAAPAVAAPAAAQLTYRGGPLLTSVQLCTVFWGAAWTAAAQQATLERLNAFAQFVVSSAYLDQLAEYSTQGKTIGHGTFVGTATVPDTALGTSVTDGAVQALLDRQVAARTVPAPTPNSLYFVLLPAGVAVVAGSDSSCQTFCGYHDRSASGLFYAVVPSPDCSGCLAGLQPLDALTSVASHELAEAVTDPVPGQGWYDDANGEIGDICAWQNKQLGGYLVQRLWSNRADACV